jgi:nicotinate-nucleotide adenylyltransferase
MGGTFDPIHYGHLFAAEEVMEELSLDKVVFIPTGTPPHKSYPSMASALERYEMTLLAVARNERFEISRTETERTGLSYTLDTLRVMKGIYPSSVLFFITGIDAVREMDKWRAPFEISLLCSLVVVKRPGYDEGELNELPEGIKNSLELIDSPMLDISATDIRKRVHDGKCVRYLLPETVRAYIEKNKLYSVMDGESN